MNKTLDILSCYGIRSDSLGNYLAGLGLLAAVSQRWPSIRSCWRNGYFVLGHENMGWPSVENFLLNDWEPTPYERWWKEAQKSDTKAKSDDSIWLERSKESIKKVRLLDAHIVASKRNQFNPVLGTGGNVGKRDLEKAVIDASNILERSGDKKKSWLAFTLHGNVCCEFPGLNNAGTWFVYANKTYNSGQDWYREGEISPWSFILALEGAMLLTGSTSRRLSAKARPYAVFPFITEAPVPSFEGEIGLVKAEFWAPIWEQPATLAEVRSLLERGLARIGQRTAKSPHEFAVAAMAAGVDAGVSAFVRFALRQTTSSQVYEAIPRERITTTSVKSQESKIIEPLLPWIDRLPFEPSDNKQRGKFKGLRGPVEQALIKIAARSDDPELWRKFIICLAGTQERIDCNKNLRNSCRALPLLDQGWFKKCWPTPPAEILVARAIASIGAGTDMPIIVNINGIELDKKGQPSFSGERKPHSAVWHGGHLLHALADVIERRLVDADEVSPLPLIARHVCSKEILMMFLSRRLDFDLIQRWIPPLSLIDWEQIQINGQPDTDQKLKRAPDGTYLFYSFFYPLFSPSPLQIDGETLFPDHLMPRAILARRLLNLIRQGSLGEAIQLARGRYFAAGHDTVTPPTGLLLDGELLSAALLVPIASIEIAAGLRRWIKPNK